MIGNKRAIYLLIVSLFMLALISCDKKTKDGEKVIDTYGIGDEATMITHKTAGMINPDDEIIIRFAEAMVEKGMVGNPISKTIFNFDPSVDGVAIWLNQQVISFKPNRELQPRQSYKGHLDLGELFPDRESLNDKKVDLEFDVAGQQINSFNIQIDPVGDDPSRVIARGNISFTQPIDKETLESAIRFELNDNRLDVKFDIDDDVFKFETDVIRRNDFSRSLNVSIDGEIADLMEDYEYSRMIPALSKLTIIEARPDRSQHDLAVEIELSDKLKQGINFSGFIKVEPDVKIKVTSMGKIIHIGGDFEYGKSYNITLRKGIRSHWETELDKDFVSVVEFEEMTPSVEFIQKGSYLTGAGDEKVYFKTANIRAVDLVVKKVYANNVSFFLQEQNLFGKKKGGFYTWGFERVGKEIHSEKLEFGETRNQFIINELDLGKIFNDGNKGLYIIELNSKEEDLLVDLNENFPNTWDRRNYIRNNCHTSKMIILSDLGITVKRSGDKYEIFVTDLISSRPLGGVNVQLRSYQNQVIASGKSDVDGYVALKANDDVFFIEASKGEQRTIIREADGKLSTSVFDTDGVRYQASGNKAYIYTDRGIYRPGDSIHISIVVRNDGKAIPDGHPVKFKFYDSRNRLVAEEVTKDGKDGFYSVSTATELSSPTGNWRANFEIAGDNFDHNVKVETFAPQRLRVSVESDKESIFPKIKRANFKIESSYLFGAPAANLKYNAQFSIVPMPLKIEKFSKFSFVNEAIEVGDHISTKQKGNLDANGHAAISWQFPDIKNPPTRIGIRADVSVFEKGGRAVDATSTVPIDHYKSFVGVLAPSARYVMVDDKLETFAVFVNKDGMPIAGRKLEYKIYRNTRYWWYDYDNRNDFRSHFKTDSRTSIVATGSITTGNVPVAFKYSPEDWGELLIEVSDPVGGHSAAFFVSATGWANRGNVASAEMINFETDRESYTPGDSAIIVVRTPSEGRALLTIEKGYNIIHSEWKTLKGDHTRFKIKISEEMAPNAYAFVSIIQPHAQTTNDRPMRFFGYAPIMVELPHTRIGFKISAPDEITPNSKFSIDLASEDGKACQFTIAVVDEGILNITRFKTPDPWEYFFAKEGLMINTWDSYSDVIGAIWGDIGKRFAIGGDAYFTQAEDLEKVRRFKPVSLFQSPIESDANGRAQVEFDMPDYIGSVRVMAVAVRGHSYGSAELDVPVRSELMVMPSFPRVLGPADIAKIPVTVFTSRDDIGDVTISVETDDLTSPVGPATKKIRFDGAGEKTLRFPIEAAKAVGIAKIKFTATSGKFKDSKEIEFAVRPSNPMIYQTESALVEANSEYSFTIMDEAIEGTTSATLTLSKLLLPPLEKRLKWLIRYPYGCLEQRISAAFPQLFIGQIIDLSEKQQKEIDKNVNNVIKGLGRFQISDGGFAFWSSASKSNPWVSNYAGHFLVEAKEKGYHVSEDIFNDWLRYAKRMSRAAQGQYIIRTYRLYILAKAGSADVGAMNYLRESSQDQMDQTSMLFLAGAYNYIGEKKAASKILSNALKKRDLKSNHRYSYGSTLRNKSIMLEVLTLLDDRDQALSLFEDISRSLAEDSWYSTQTTAYSLMAIGKYSGKIKQQGKIEAIVEFENGKTKKVTIDKVAEQIELNNFGERVTVRTKNSSIYANLDWAGVPLREGASSEQYGINMSVRWRNEDGADISPENIKQGEYFYLHMKIKNASSSTLSDVALMQIIPAGWEIVNPRISGAQAPGWISRNNRQSDIKHIDIRDDRIMWFFDLTKSYYSSEYEFYVRLYAAMPGTYYLPPTICEAMYDHDYRSRIAGREVQVVE